MPDLKYTITNTAQGTGIKQTAEELKKLTIEAQGSSTALGRIAQAGKSLEKDSQSLSREMQQQVAASKLATATSNVQESSVRRLAVGMKQLGNEFPIVGAAMRALLNPWTALAAIIGIAVVKIKEAISVQNELAKASADLSVRLDPLIIRQIRTKQLQTETAEEIAKHNRALAAQNTLVEANARATQEAADAMGRRHAAEKVLADAQKELALAQAGDDPEARARIEQDFRAREETRLKLVAAAEEETAHRRVRDTRATLTEARVGLREARPELEQVRKEQAAKGEDAAVALEEAQKKMKALEDDLKAAELGEKVPSVPETGGPLAIPFTPAQRVSRVRAAIESLRPTLDAARARVAGIQAPVEAAQARVTGLEAQEKQAAGQLPSLEAAHQKIVLDETLRRQTAASVAELKVQTELLTSQLELEKERTRLTRELHAERKRENSEISSQLRSNSNKSN